MVLCLKEAALDNPSNILKKLPKEKWDVFTEGREITILLKYFNIIPIGIVRIKTDGLTVYNGRDVYRLIAEIETSGFISNFYKAQAKFSSYMDKNKLHSLRYAESIILPDKNIETKEIIFDQDNLIMTRGNTKRKILPNTQDPLSTMFYLRTLDFGADKVFVSSLLSKEDIYGLKTKVFKKTEGIWKIKVTVARENRSFHRGGNFLVWITDDTRRLPLLIKTWTQIGLITTRLINIK
jgi:hypothetical protein